MTPRSSAFDAHPVKVPSRTHRLPGEVPRGIGSRWAAASRSTSDARRSTRVLHRIIQRIRRNGGEARLMDLAHCGEVGSTIDEIDVTDCRSPGSTVQSPDLPGGALQGS